MKKHKIDKLTGSLILVIVVGCLIYIWGSQYYYPSNYLSAIGTLQNTHDGNKGESNYAISFVTQSGQQITQRYQTFDPSLPSGSSIVVHYNQSDPAQIRVKPTTFGLVADLVLSLVVLPIGVYVSIRRFKK